MRDGLRVASTPRRRIYLAASIAGALLGCSGASPSPTSIHHVESGEVRSLLDRAAERLDAGARDEAAALCRDALRADPEGVAAHRALQNLELADHRRGELLLRYRKWRDAAPERSDRWYLWGRLLSSPGLQRDAFERAHALDPRNPWPLLGLAHLALGAGDTQRALDLFRIGRGLGPDLPDLELGMMRALLPNPARWPELERVLVSWVDGEHWDVSRLLLLAELEERRERPRDSITLLTRLLARVPRNTEVAATLADRFEANGTADDANFLLRELSDSAREPGVRLLLARAHAMVGDSTAALALFGGGPDLEERDRTLRRRLLLARGSVAEALALERPRFAALTAVGADTSEFESADRLAQSGPGFDRVQMAQAFRAIGWIEEATTILRPLAEGEETPPAERLLGELFDQRRLEAELEVLALGTYKAFDSHAPVPTFDDFLGRVGGAVRRTLGDDLVAGAPRSSFWPIGELLDPEAETGIAAWFKARGRLLVAGNRSGKPPELFLAPILATRRLEPSGTRLSFTDGVEIPGYLEHRGARFSGAALVNFVYLDVAAIEDDVGRLLRFDRTVGPNAARIAADPVLPAADDDERRSLDEPAEVAVKLEFKALAAFRARHPDESRAALLAEAIDAVLAHEVGHLEDAERFLPILHHLGGIIWQLVKLGFSAARAEEWLEMRAECRALARAENPWLVLASCASQLGGGEPALTPHAGGYRDLLARLVEVLDDDPEEFPSLARDGVLVQQLDRLSEDELREAARRVLADLGTDLTTEAAPGATPPRAGAR
jgi:thioredoxin-like negative regulator of GroEL